MSYDINYEDERFTEVENDKQAALSNLEETYGGIVNESDKYYQAQVDASKQWANTQGQLQQQQTDFAIEQIEQQKAQAQKDYLKEQSGAYVDWQKEKNNYGATAEQMAANGLIYSGYSESSKVGMYNAYQNRVATARESYNQAVMNYNNAIKEAQLQNNSVLAEIAYESLQTQLEMSLQGFQYKNQLVLDLASKKQDLENTYYSRYQDVLNQINTENSLAEQIRQYNESLALEKQQMEEAKAQWQKEFDFQQKQFDESVRQFNLSYSASRRSSGGSSRRSNGSSGLSSGSAQISSKKTSTGNSGSKSYAVNTDYYRGSLNSDAEKYGTFSNGYQPKGISGHGTLSKTGEMIPVYTEVQYGLKSGQKKLVNQNIWVAEDGTKWYWEGRENRYVRYNG